MSRVVSLYLPTWPTDRLRRQTGDAAPPPERPLVIAQTQARVPDLHIEPADPAADAAALARLALWALRRYSPVGAIDLPDGLLIDATGVAHLFGGEAALLGELRARLTDRLESVNPGFDVEVMTLAAILAEPLA
jgi:protein ImuB